MDYAKVHINAGEGYNVHIGKGLLDRCGTLISQKVKPCRMAVITDSNVAPLYLDTVTNSLYSSGFEVISYVFPAGEKSKNIGTFSDILEFLAESQLTRSDCVAALGGGVTGDITGYAAGCYLRGIKYIQLPTTFLAAVDSSVGGKTAVNLAAGKNLAGVFNQPESVICDISCLDTLSKEVFADGTAEAIKTGVLSGEDLFSLLESDEIKERLPDIIKKCVLHKGMLVEEDEFELGLRKTLNLGHTTGHAIEKLSGYEIPHGHAVAAGMAIITRAAARLGVCDNSSAGRIIKTLERYGLPTSTEFTAAELAHAALSDKKRTGGYITLIIPRKIGECFLETIPVTKLEEYFTTGLEVDT